MTTPPKTKQEIRDSEAYKYAEWDSYVPELKYSSSTLRTDLQEKETAFKAGFDCAYNESEKLTRVTNEALKIAVEALEFIETDLDITHVKAALAEIRRLRGEG